MRFGAVWIKDLGAIFGLWLIFIPSIIYVIYSLKIAWFENIATKHFVQLHKLLKVSTYKKCNYLIREENQWIIRYSINPGNVLDRCRLLL